MIRDSETSEAIGNVTIISGRNSSQSDQSGSFTIDAVVLRNTISNQRKGGYYKRNLPINTSPKYSFRLFYK